MFLEVLHFALMLLCLLERGECAQIAPLAGCGILLARIETELPGFELANHVHQGCGPRSARCLHPRALVMTQSDFAKQPSSAFVPLVPSPIAIPWPVPVLPFARRSGPFLRD